MNYQRAIEISAAGMTAEKARIEVAALNLSNMNVSGPPGTPAFRPMKALLRSAPVSFDSVMGTGASRAGLVRADIVPQIDVSPRAAYEPGHPHADAAGWVSYPAVDHTQEMVTVVAALRSYEANVAVLQTSRTMAARALEIGGQ